MRIRVLPLLTLFVVTSLAHGKSSLLSFDQIRSELQPFGLSSVQFSSTDYQIPNFRWIYREFMPFYKSYLKGSRARYQDEGVDCDNFCIFFQSALFQRKVQLGYEHAGNTAAGIMYCDIGPRQSIRHVIIIIRTDRGWFAVEAENGDVTPLGKYLRKNRPIRAVF